MLRFLIFIITIAGAQGAACQCNLGYRNGAAASDTSLCMGPSEGGKRPCYPTPCNADWTACTNPADDVSWVKDTTHTGKRPDCPFVGIRSDGANYMWNTLAKCKEGCIKEPTGKCNMVSRFGETYKQSTDLYHCRFYACPDPENLVWISQQQWGNGASTSNTYKLPIRHYILNENIVNKTRWINRTRLIDKFVDKVRWLNETRWINQTRLVHKYVYETRWVNATRWVNQTRIVNRFVDKTRWVNKTRQIDRFIDKARWINKTQWINRTRLTPVFVDKLLWTNKTRWTNRTRWVDRIRWTNRTRWVDRIRWTNKTGHINSVVYINRTNGQYPDVDQIVSKEQNASKMTGDIRGRGVQCERSGVLNLIEICLVLALVAIVVLWVLRRVHRRCRTEKYRNKTEATPTPD